MDVVFTFLWPGKLPQFWLLTIGGCWTLTEWTEEAAWMLENGTSTEYLMEWRSWTTTLETLRNDNLRRWFPPELPGPPACPMALLTCSVLNKSGCRSRVVSFVPCQKREKRGGREEEEDSGG